MRRDLLALFVLPFTCALLSAQTALVQVIHNCADPTAATVDVYINGERSLDDLTFRTATPFIDLPLNVTVAIAPASSQSAAEAFITKELTLAVDETYLLVASGVVNPDNFTPNGDPEAKAILLDLIPTAQARLAGVTETDVDVIFVHGVTDGPRIDLLADLEVIFSEMSYGEISTYLSIRPADYTLNIAPSGGPPLVSFSADLSFYGGQAITIIASGFISPVNNQNGPALGLFAVSKDGGAFVEFPQISVQQTARVQIIHNAADPLAAVVDLYVKGKRVADNFSFRSATPFITIQANTDVDVAVAPPTSESVDDAIVTFPFNVPPGRYVMVANGVLTPSAYAPNPDPRAPATSFNVYPITGIRPGSQNPGEVDVIIFHGSTDAPAVDITANGQLALVSDLFYGSASPYNSLPAISYTINVAPAGGAPVANFRGNLTGRAGQSMIVVASGFLDPSKNNNGPAFGLFAAVADGGDLIPLPPVSSSVTDDTSNDRMTISPNPVMIGNTIEILAEHGIGSVVTITSLLGDVVLSSTSGDIISDGTRFFINTAALASGTYIVTVTRGTSSNSSRLTILN